MPDTPAAAPSKESGALTYCSSLSLGAPGGQVFTASRRKCVMAADNFSRTCSGLVPGIRRSHMRNQDQLLLLMAFEFIIVGMKISVIVPVSVPVNPSRETPTISIESLPARNLRPMTLGSRPKRRVQ